MLLFKCHHGELCEHFIIKIKMDKSLMLTPREWDEKQREREEKKTKKERKKERKERKKKGHERHDMVLKKVLCQPMWVR